MGDFLLLLNLKLYEVDPQDDMQEIHLWPLCSAHLKEPLDWKLATPRGKMQGDRLKLLLFFTYLKCRLCHCCPCSGSLLQSAWKPKSLRWPWSTLCARIPRAVTSFPTCSLCSFHSSHMALHRDTGRPLFPRPWLIPSPLFIFAQRSPSQWGLLCLLYFTWKLLLLSIFPH